MNALSLKNGWRIKQSFKLDNTSGQMPLVLTAIIICSVLVISREINSDIFNIIFIVNKPEYTHYLMCLMPTDVAAKV